MRIWTSSKSWEPIIPVHLFIWPSPDLSNTLYQALEAYMHWTWSLSCLVKEEPGKDWRGSEDMYSTGESVPAPQVA